MRRSSMASDGSTAHVSSAGARLRRGGLVEEDDEQRTLLSGLLTDDEVRERRASGVFETGVSQPSKCEIARTMCHVAAPFFMQTESRYRAWSLASVVVFLIVLQAYIDIYGWADLAQTIPDALIKREVDKFWGLMFKTLCVIVESQTVNSLLLLAQGSFALEWRRQLTRTLLGGYLGSKDSFYQVKLQYSSSIDNPDQRIGQDTDEFAIGAVALAIALIQAVCKIFNCIALFGISAYLCAFAILFSILLTVGEVFAFGGPLVSLMRLRLQQEAHLRFGLMRIRENAESIAFYQGAPYEKMRCGQFFTTLLETLYKRLAVEISYQWTSNIGSGVGSMLPKLLLGPRVLSGSADIGIIYQAESLFGSFVGGMLVLAKQLESFASLGAQAVRISELQLALAKIHAGEANLQFEPTKETLRSSSASVARSKISLNDLPTPMRSLSGNGHLVRVSPPGPLVLTLERVTLVPPGSHDPLFTGLSLLLHEGESLMICGDSGCGKSSLLRAIAGLWNGGSGSIERCNNRTSFFMPQKPYLCLGSLRQNATYPLALEPSAEDGAEASDGPTDEEICRALDSFGIGYLVNRFGLDQEVDFEGVLSGGEKQRLGFARVILRRSVRFAMLDEATAALDVNNETEAYRLLRERVPCYVSVGHRANLEQFHSHKLVLKPMPSGGCSWSATRMDGSSWEATAIESRGI